MKIPHPALMRLYGTDDVFFKKASAEPRIADELFEKLALPMAAGMKPAVLKPPTQAMRTPTPAPSLGIKPPTTAPSPGAAPPRAQTQMQTPTPSALSAPPSAPRSAGFAPGDTSWKSDPQAARGLSGPEATQARADKANVAAKIQAGKTPSGTMAPNAPAPKTVATPAASTEAPAAKSGTPWNKILAVGGALGAGALGLGALNSGLKFLGGHGAPPPADYGYAPGGFQVPMGVNGYGAPQPGSRMM